MLLLPKPIKASTADDDEAAKNYDELFAQVGVQLCNHVFACGLLPPYWNDAWLCVACLTGPTAGVAVLSHTKVP
jgi:hypothetical protein